MKLLFDLTYIDSNSNTGVSSYAIRLLNGLAEINNTYDIYLLVSESNITYISKIFPTFNYIFFKNILSEKPYVRLLKKKTYIKEVEKNIIKYNIDIYIIPFFTLWTMVPSNIKSIAVIHDLQPFTLNGAFKNLIYKQLFYQNLKGITHVVTISQFSKNEILKYFSLLKGRLSYIYNSIDTITDSPNQRIDDYNFPYILNVNAMTNYKNQITIVRAFNIIKDKIPHKLVLKGKKTSYWFDTIDPYIKQNCLEGRIILNDANLNDNELNQLYKNASLFVNSSTMEGFGFTPIEAAIHKIPVITSKETALYETTLGILNYYEPVDDAMKLANKILEVLDNMPDNIELTNIANRFIESYSQNKQAYKYLELFNSIYENRN